MGSPISPVIADLVMEEIEETAIVTASHPPKWWFRYVDDSHACLRKDLVDEFYQHLNSINTNIQFTLELEDTNGQGLPFLDTITIRRGAQLEMNVYRKPTHTDRYLDFDSHYPICSQHLAKQSTEHTIDTERKTRRNETGQGCTVRQQLSLILHQ